MARDVDVVVAGAGPAGSVTAWYAAKHGASVLLLEKRQDIGTPVRCGEGLSKVHLDYIGIQPSSEWVANEVQGARIFSPSGHVLHVGAKHAGDEVGLVVERDKFDKALAKKAAAAGAKIRLKTTVYEVVKEDGQVVGVKTDHFGKREEIRCGAVVAADGFESQVGRWCGIETRLKAGDIMSCLQYRLTNIDCDARYCDFYLGSKIAPGGYIWVFPKDRDTANVGIGIMTRMIKKKAETKWWLDRWIDTMPGIKKGQNLDAVAGGVSTCPPLEKTVGDGFLLVGDAARQIDPITGGGISNGCEAGRIAGEVLAEATQANDFSSAFLQKYEKGWRARMENRLYRNYLAKEKLAKLSDDHLDKIVESVAAAGVEKLSVHAILKAVQTKYPELVKEFEQFL